VDAVLRLAQLLAAPYFYFTHARVHQKDVVIVGASFGGLAVLHELQGRHDLRITLVDYKDYFEYTPGILRCFVDAPYLRQLTCKLPSRANRVVTGEVTAVAESAVTLRNADGSSYELSFDYLVLACGSTYQQPIKPVASEPSLAQREASWAKAAARLEESSSVLIVGAGAVGVELAGEVLTKFPKKKVTIVDMAKSILPGFAPESVQFALRWLEAKGVELRLGEAIADIGDTSITLKSGEVLPAGVVYKCVGVLPNTKMLQDSPFKSAFGFRDSIIVNDQLQLAGHPNIFAVGDMMSHESRELKLGHTAEINGHLAALNIIAQLTEKPLLKYPDGVVGAKTSPKIFCLSLGKYDASLGFNRLVINGALPAVVKWVLEWTKVAAAAERPVGLLFWNFADWSSNLLGRTLLA